MSPWMHIALFWLLLTALAGMILALLLGPALRQPRGFVLWIGLSALALVGYGFVGTPGLIVRQNFAMVEHAKLEQEIAALEAATKAEPKKPDHWRDLGDAQLRIGRPELALESYKQETLLTQGDPDALLRLGKAQVLSAGGRVTEDAVRTFTMLQSLRPNPQAELFLAMHDAEMGSKTKAKARFGALAENSDIPAEVRAAAQEQIKALK